MGGAGPGWGPGWGGGPRWGRGCGGRAGMVGGGGWDTGGETWLGSRVGDRAGIQVGAGLGWPVGAAGMQVGCGVQTAGAPEPGLQQLRGELPAGAMPPLPAALGTRRLRCWGRGAGAGAGVGAGRGAPARFARRGAKLRLSVSLRTAPLPPGSRSFTAGPARVAQWGWRRCPRRPAGCTTPEPQFTLL